MSSSILQPTHLVNETLQLIPLQNSDFNGLYEAASDPLIWEQHPTPTRYQLAIFENYFKGAIESKGAFAIINTISKEYMGCTRFYNYNTANSTIHIGYTFFTRKYWGTGINSMVKKMMLQHIFNYVNSVLFHVGACNLRSQKAMDKIGAQKIGEAPIEYFAEKSNTNYIYEIKKSTWLIQQPFYSS
jgi:RimJ/RimL family protein N-acetyltransferase